MARKDKSVTLDDLERDKNPCFEMLHRESDRGMALAASAFIDDMLGVALRAALVDDHRIVERLLGRDRPFSTFSAKIDLAYCLAIIERHAWEDLNAIREIRNEFAHVRGKASFRKEGISEKCSNLHAPSGLVVPPDTPRGKAARRPFLLATILWLEALSIKAEEQQHAQFATRGEAESDI